MRVLGLNIKRDEFFWAKIDWYLYKFFRIKRSIPCGRTKKTKYLCCCLYPDNKNSYISKDKHKIICKVCGGVHHISSKKIININETLKF